MPAPWCRLSEGFASFPPIGNKIMVVECGGNVIGFENALLSG